MKMGRQRHYTFGRRVSAVVLLVALCSGTFVIGGVKAATGKAVSATTAEYLQDQTGSSAQFCNQGTIGINDYAPATPYPSSINVSGLTGLISKVMVTLTGVQHTFPDDINILLVGPQGQKIELMRNTGGGFGISNVNLTFDDEAPAYLPHFGAIISGTYKPTYYLQLFDSFPAPAPGTSVV